jgi:anti-sigma B factor antagonist
MCQRKMPIEVMMISMAPKIDVHVIDGVKVLSIFGDLAGSDDGAFTTIVTDHITGPGERILLDLAGVRFLNSMGLGDLVRVAAQANLQECRVALANPIAFVAGVLQMTRLDRFFEVHPTVEAAIAAFNQPRPKGDSNFS